MLPDTVFPGPPRLGLGGLLLTQLFVNVMWPVLFEALAFAVATAPKEAKTFFVMVT